MRLDRVEKTLKEVVLMAREEVSINRKTEVRVKMTVMINTALREIQDILNEVSEHNICIKYWLRDELVNAGGMFIMFFVFSLGDIEWYYRAFTFFTVFCLLATLGVSFSNAAQLYIRILSLAKLLHSCQIVYQSAVQLQSSTRSKSASCLQQAPNPRQVLKTKYQIIRMIHRVSSHYLRIGYTEGNGESFSPASVGEFVETIVIWSLMFMNTKYSAIVDVLNK